MKRVLIVCCALAALPAAARTVSLRDAVAAHYQPIAMKRNREVAVRLPL